MCILIACPPGKTPDHIDLIDAIDQNPDGHGWAIRAPQGMLTMRSLNGEQAKATFLEARDKYPQAWAIWHSRLATQGTVSTDNCHPFRVPGRPWVMGHNGVLDLKDPPGIPGNRSDTRILAEDILPGYRWTDLLAMQEEWESYIGHSKVIILSSKKEKKGPILILNEQLGDWEKDGCWWSARPRYYLCGSSSWSDNAWPKSYTGSGYKSFEAKSQDEIDEIVEWWENQKDLEDRAIRAELFPELPAAKDTPKGKDKS